MKIEIIGPGCPFCRRLYRSGRINLGHALETAVFNDLERRKAEVGYVKMQAGFEVDSHARFLEGREELIQVCADPSEPGTKARELRALAEARREHPRASARLLILERDQAAALGTTDVIVQPAYQWLLEGDGST